ncbi:MAG: hypothetical protein LC127_08890 [Chitinophagales bacterium]|nr:hypothetical protein [Chitinophagales bacterium]
MSKRKSTISAVKTVKHEAPKVMNESINGAFHTESFFKKYWLASVILMVLSFVLYYKCIPYNYVLDDQIVITDNQYTKKGFSGLWDILTTESFQGYFGEKKDLVQGNRYRPLSIMTFAIEYGIIGDLNPSVSHVINILLYGLTGILLMMVLVMMFRNYKSRFWWFSIPFLTAIFFIGHPIHTEAVANIKGRDEIMSMLFSLLALYSGMRFMDVSGKKWLITSAVAYFLGLLSKENAITFLAVIPLTIYFFSHTDWSKLKKLILWLLITTILYLVLRANTAGMPVGGQEIKDLMNNPFLGMTPAEKFGSIMYTLGKYIALLVWPHPLSHDYYPYAIPKISIFAIIPAIAFIGYVAMGYFGIKGLKTKSVYAYAILFYLITLSIVSNIFINLGTFMNERFVFMSSAGFCLAVAYLLSAQLPKWFKGGQIAAYLIAGLMLIGYGAKTMVRVPVWKDALSLNQAAVAVSSNSARANSFMSTALFDNYKETLTPNTYKTLTDKQRNLLDWAEYYANKAVEIVPDYQNANLMLVGVATERYKSSHDIERYIINMKPIILRRPDISFIKEFSEYLKNKGHDDKLFPFYLEVGKELSQFTDKRRDWSIQYLGYAYDIQPMNKQVNEALANAYELLGRNDQAQRFRVAANSLQ